MIGPVTIGAIAQVFGLRVGFLLCAAAGLVVLAWMSMGPRRPGATLPESPRGEISDAGRASIHE